MKFEGFFFKVGMKEGIYSDNSKSKTNMKVLFPTVQPPWVVGWQGYGENATQFVSEI